MRLSLLLLVGIVALAAACGSGGGGPPSKAELAQGKKVFVTAGCGSCHSLSAAGTKGVVGGPLDGFRFKPAFVDQRVREGGGGMPAFGKKLSDDDIKAVAAFVVNASGG
jgi:sulfite dehydrogenase